MGYMRRLTAGQRRCWRTKLMFVGLGGAGKTSLLNAMKTNKSIGEMGPTELTDGIDISEWAVSAFRKKTFHIQSPLQVNTSIDGNPVAINFSMWDFAGQSVYYNTHQFFLSSRAVYFLLWNSRLGYEHAGLDFWLSSIACHAPDAPIFVIGTHADQAGMGVCYSRQRNSQVYRADLPREELRATYPYIVDFFFVSSATRQGISELVNELISVASSLPYMGGQIPTTLLELEGFISQ